MDPVRRPGNGSPGNYCFGWSNHISAFFLWLLFPFLHDGVRRVESVYWLVSYVSPVHLTFSEGVRMSLFYSAEQTYSVGELSAGPLYSVER
jgi:hypothetical protein